MDINELTIGEVTKINALLNAGNKEEETLYEIGKNYFIRTVTMALTGKLEKVSSQELKLSSAAWIADTGRLYNALADGFIGLDSSEIEPFPNDIIVGRGAVIDATIYDHDLPRNQK